MDNLRTKNHENSVKIPKQLQSLINNARSFSAFLATSYFMAVLFSLWLLLSDAVSADFGYYLVFVLVMSILHLIAVIKLKSNGQDISAGWSLFAAIIALPSAISIIGILINYVLWNNAHRVGQFKKDGIKKFKTDEEWLLRHKNPGSSEKMIILPAVFVGIILSIIIFSLYAYSYSTPSQNDLTGGGGGNAVTAIDIADRAVIEFKSETSLPYAVDDVTTLTNVESNGNAIEYYYDIEDADTSNLSDESLKASVQEGACSNASFVSLLDSGVVFSYIYNVVETGQLFTFAIYPIDCI